VVLVLIVGGAFFWLTSAAQAAPNAAATLTVFRPIVSVAHTCAAYAAATTGTRVQAGDSVKSDATGRGAIGLPDGTLTRLASNTEITLTAAHFNKTGTLHDASISQKVGRTLTSVQHLVSGASFKVVGHSASASVRGTKFEVLVRPDQSMLVKLFEGELDFDGQNHVHLTAGQEASSDPQGHVSNPIPIPHPDPNDPDDPFGPELQASDATSLGTTPGTEQNFIGSPIHNGEQQQYTYSYAAGTLLRASVGYAGSLMSLDVVDPNGKTYHGSGPSPVLVSITNPGPGIYKIIVKGDSGIGPNGETPFVSVAGEEDCVSATIETNGAVRHAYTGQDLSSTVAVSGLSNVSITVKGDSTSGGIISGTATYNGVGVSGDAVIYAHGGLVGVIPVSASALGVNVPAEQVASQIASVAGSDLSNINPGFYVDRLFTCQSVLMIDGRAP